MRTTLTLDPDVAALLKKAVANGNASFKDVVNTALRAGLTAQLKSPKKRYVLRPGPPSGGWLVDINDNGAIQEMFDLEDFDALSRREPPASGD